MDTTVRICNCFKYTWHTVNIPTDAVSYLGSMWCLTMELQINIAFLADPRRPLRMPARSNPLKVLGEFFLWASSSRSISLPFETSWSARCSDRTKLASFKRHWQPRLREPRQVTHEEQATGLSVPDSREVSHLDFVPCYFVPPIPSAGTTREFEPGTTFRNLSDEWQKSELIYPVVKSAGMADAPVMPPRPFQYILQRGADRIQILGTAEFPVHNSCSVATINQTQFLQVLSPANLGLTTLYVRLGESGGSARYVTLE